MKENKPQNETGNNPEAEQEKEVLPSFFQTLKTSTSKPLSNRKVLEYNSRERMSRNAIPA